MNKKTLAIVSSYDELCGNASYTKALEKELSHHFDVSVIDLDVDTLRNGRRKKVKRHIHNLCNQIKGFHCVNIQLEAGLFGSTVPAITRNFLALAKASNKLVITMHRYHSLDRYPDLIRFAKYIFHGSFLGYLHHCRKTFANNRYVPFFKKVVRYCQRNQVPIIVHTKRDKNNIELDLGFQNVFDHPLCFYNQNQIQEFKNQNGRKEFYKDLNLDDKKIYIGVFGFLNKYKGHETAIRALHYLPKNYELIICGSQHPHTIRVEESVNPYIEELLKKIDLWGLGQRVKFVKMSDENDFLKALIYCDYNVLPYLEVKQGGSAIASLSLETNSKAIFSQNFAFFELDRYAKNAFKMFSIGNYMELANAILNYDPLKYVNQLNEYHTKYNISSSARLYRDLLNGEPAIEILPSTARRTVREPLIPLIKTKI